ncbi:MAG: hypothetical protein ACR2P5_09045 [Gammaproteobacteria bacterium]
MGLFVAGEKRHYTKLTAKSTYQNRAPPKKAKNNAPRKCAPETA